MDSDFHWQFPMSQFLLIFSIFAHFACSQTALWKAEIFCNECSYELSQKISWRKSLDYRMTCFLKIFDDFFVYVGREGI